MLTKYKIGGSFEPPVNNYKFYVDSDYDWIKLNISVQDAKWFEVLLWDSKGILRLQFVYWKKAETVIIHKNRDKTSSAAVPGPIPKGEWIVEICGLTDKSNVDFSIDIETGNEEIEYFEKTQLLGNELWVKYDENMEALSINNYIWDRKINKEKRWYKGDFHTHTNVSDGKMSPRELLELAQKQKLDFFVTTEHNIIHTGFPKSNVLVIPGIEITDQKGHFNALGIKKWIDWTRDSKDGGLCTEEGMNRLLDEAKKAGALRSVNHPALTPWAWNFKETLLENIDVLEIWNDPTYPDNDLKATEEAIKIWNSLWNEGYKIWGIGGSDAHNYPDETYEGSKMPSMIGDPATFVYSDSVCASDILKAVGKGRVYVSRGIIIDLIIEADGHMIYPGSDLTDTALGADIQIKYMIKIYNADKSGKLIWIENGLVKEEMNIPENGEIQYCFSWKDSDYKWIRFEIWDKNNKLSAFVNPIYIGQKEHRVFKWGQLIELTEGMYID